MATAVDAPLTPPPEGSETPETPETPEPPPPLSLTPEPVRDASEGLSAAAPAPIQRDLVARSASLEDIEGGLTTPEAMAPDARRPSWSRRPSAKELEPAAGGRIVDKGERMTGAGVSVGPTDFKVLKVIGRGGFGRVFLVRYKHTGVCYAMKVISKELLRRKNQVEIMKAERTILTKVTHPFVVGLQVSFQTDSKLFLVMDYLQGGELFFHLRKEGLLLAQTAKFYVAEIALALEFLHSVDVLHRDLKPENLLLDRSAHVCLTDFGLAKELSAPPDENADDENRTRTICGTTEYMAPEMLKGKGYGKAVDWWSLGTLAYEMMTGAPPFRGRNNKEINQKIINGKLKLPSWMDMDSHSLIKGLLQKNAQKRLGASRSTRFEVGGVRALKNHRFFHGIDWDALLAREITPPLSLTIEAPDDTSYFDDEFTKMDVSRSIGKMSDKELGRTHSDNFDRFSFIHNDFTPPPEHGGVDPSLDDIEEFDEEAEKEGDEKDAADGPTRGPSPPLSPDAAPFLPSPTAASSRVPSAPSSSAPSGASTPARIASPAPDGAGSGTASKPKKKRNRKKKKAEADTEEQRYIPGLTPGPPPSAGNKGKKQPEKEEPQRSIPGLPQPGGGKKSRRRGKKGVDAATDGGGSAEGGNQRRSSGRRSKSPTPGPDAPPQAAGQAEQGASGETAGGPGAMAAVAPKPRRTGWAAMVGQDPSPNPGAAGMTRGLPRGPAPRAAAATAPGGWDTGADSGWSNTSTSASGGGWANASSAGRGGGSGGGGGGGWANTTLQGGGQARQPNAGGGGADAWPSMSSSARGGNRGAWGR
mmetsp:Transcript_39863/g.124624  ORF Transcript_39863/g.124624 Transcript_39863/m.124624 type:complete len:813 (-) Transcript_39863:716-3154(-)